MQDIGNIPGTYGNHMSENMEANVQKDDEVNHICLFCYPRSIQIEKLTLGMTSKVDSFNTFPSCFSRFGTELLSVEVIPKIMIISQSCTEKR